jgi:hypothetical protein
MFSCITIEGEQRLLSDLSITCNKGAHFVYSYGVAIPSIIVWGLGIPMFAFILLKRESNKLETMEVREKFGFLYRGFKKDFFFWEIVIMYRKIAMIVIAVLIKTWGTLT